MSVFKNSICSCQQPSLFVLCTLLKEEETFTCAFDHTGARPEFWCYHVKSSYSTWSLAGFTEAFQKLVEQALRGSHVAQALLFL